MSSNAQKRSVLSCYIENGNIANQIHGFTIDYGKFTVVYCESVNLIGYITVDYLLIVNSYASVHIARHV